MIEKFGNKVINSYKNVCHAVKDITMAIQGDPGTTSKYRLIPGDKSGKNNFVVNAVDFNTLNETIIFIGAHTIGVKLFSKRHTPICQYAITRKDGVQIAQIKYPDGTGMEQRCVFDDFSKAYLFEKSNIIIPAEELVDLNAYGNAILQKGFKVGITYAQDRQTKQLKIGVNIPKTNMGFNPLLYNPNIVDAELRRLSGFVSSNAQSFFNVHTNFLSLVSPKDIYTNVAEFKKSFKEMIKQLKKDQDEYPYSNEPDTPIKNDR